MLPFFIQEMVIVASDSTRPPKVTGELYEPSVCIFLHMLKIFVLSSLSATLGY